MSSRPHALVLTGDVGMGHHVVTEVVAEALERVGWSTEVLDCMAMLGPMRAKAGDWLFRRASAIPTLYDAVHFAHFRPGSRLARAMDQAATDRLVPALRAHLEDAPAEVIVSTFATGASAIAKLAAVNAEARPATVALCTDVCPHSMWVQDGLRLFLVTSPAAAAGVRRYAPRVPIVVLPAPVRAGFHEAPPQAEARRRLGVDPEASCVLVMGGGWGLGPLAEMAEMLAVRGVTVLAVAGHNARLASALEAAAQRQPRVVPFGFTDEVPALMAAADLVLTTPGATTCSEARVVGRPLMLLDVMPGHGRDNVQHELELGEADVCDPHPGRLVECVLSALERAAPVAERRPAAERFGTAFADALAMVGILPGLSRSPAASPGGRVRRDARAHTPDPQEVG
ncbi:MAG: glycosyltransferase [Acidimicrobiales bacterium]